MSDFSAYFQENFKKMDSLSKITHGLVENILRQNGIETLAISSRTKDLNSCLEKISRKSYRDPVAQMTDVVGIRVILYFEHQVQPVSDLIKEIFEVDEKNSFDQSRKLGHDRIGYRSNHFVCRLGKKRRHLDEYKDIYDIKFEIQVRTILQHAWAELAHDRSYKFSDGLPQEIQREINLYAGLLEISDKAFSRIVKDIDKYVQNLDEIDFYQEEVNSLTVTKFIKTFAKENNIQIRQIKDSKHLGIVVEEIRLFGISRISELQAITENKDFVVAERGVRGNTDIGLLRSMLMWDNLERYLNVSWRDSWTSISTYSVNSLLEKYPNAYDLLHDRGIEIEDPEEDEIGEDA